MKLLLDQNLAPRLVELLHDLFPNSQHVRELDLASAPDIDVWGHAKQNGFAIVSKDADFRQMSFLHGSPPKVIWLRVGNRSTAYIHSTLRAHAADLVAFDADPMTAMLVITA